ncbi:MAG: chorismate-binding protein [Janthinobacterium lividum]
MLQDMQERLHQGLFAVGLFDYELGADLVEPGHAIDALSMNARGGAGAHAAGDGDTPRPLARILLFARCEILGADEVRQWLAKQCQAAEDGNGQKSGSHTSTGTSTSIGNDQADCNGDGNTHIAANEQPAGIMNLRAGIDAAEFECAIERIHDLLAAGDAYQVNYTLRLHFDVYGTPAALYARLRQRQPVPYGALIALPDGGAVLSLSPELFLQHRRGILTARPMKGTAPATGDPQQDALRAAALAADPKNRSENLMIVDLLRNDLGRIAVLGSVQVPQLFEVARHGQVLQMTSTVTALLREETSIAAVIAAMYPCGSITGAPKRRAMQIIAELETEPRGLYTGAIGWFDAASDLASAPASPRDAIGDFCLSVPIRTLSLDPAQAGQRHGVMGVGAGIVFESRAADEFAECRVKAGFLVGLPAQFELLETMFVSRADGIRHMARHLQRLRASASCFGFCFDEQAVVAQLQAACRQLPMQGHARLRLVLQADGHCSVETGLLPALEQPVKLLLARQRIDSGQLFQRHKTSVRQFYDTAWRQAQAQGAFDMLFFNERDELAEGARSNVFLHIDGQWFTPPLSSGALPGVMRAVLLADGAWSAKERVLGRAELGAAQRIVVCNALRGPMAAQLASQPK